MRQFVRLAAAAAAIAFTAPQPAGALTISLDFVNSLTTDLLSVQTNTPDYSAYNFSALSTAQIQQAVFDAVVADYLAYPTVGTNASSPLPNGKRLNINFVLGNGIVAPSNGDPEFYHIAIGAGVVNNGFLGQACFQCVRTSNQVHLSNANGGASSGSIVGSILTNEIATLAGLASTDQQRINLLAGTVSHEVGHTLMLDHPNAALPNPGASSFSLMATGASPTSMPNGERVKDRAFAYSEFSTLINTVGITDAPAVPEPASMLVLGTGLLLLRLRRRG